MPQDQGKQRGTLGKTWGPGEQRRLGRGMGLRQRQGNTQGPSKDPTKLGIYEKCASMPKTYLLPILNLTGFR